MKLFWKSKGKILTVLTVSLILSTVFLPAAASAQENINSSDTTEINNDNEIVDTDTESIKEEITEPLKYLFEKQLNNQDIPEKEDLEFLNNITVQNVNGELILNFNETKKNYNLTVETKESNYKILTDKLDNEQLNFYNLNKNSEIEIKIKNNKTLTENVITIISNSDTLETINQDITVEINPDSEVESDIELDTETETEQETEPKPETETSIIPEPEILIEPKVTKSFNTIISSKKVNYNAIVLGSNGGIYTQPYGMQDAILYTSYKYNNVEVKVTEEATTQNGTFAKLVTLNEEVELGWINLSDISIKIYDDFLTRKEVEYYATVLSKNEGIYTQPYGMRNSVLYTSYKYNNKKVKVTEEATTASGTFVKLVSLEDSGTLGWIKKSSVKIYDGYLTTKQVEYYATVLSNNEGIYTKPKGPPGAVLYTSYKYNNKKVKATEEATTASGTFVKLVSLEDNGTLGWIKKSSVKIYDGYLTTKKVEYYATVLAKNEGIYTKPKGLPGAVLYTSYKYNNKRVKVTEEATTASGTFVKLVSLEDNGTLGWIKKLSVKAYDSFIKLDTKNYRAKVKSNNDGIYTQPKGMFDSILYTNYLFNEQTVQIVEEDTTESGVFAKIARITDGSIIGWINIKSLNIEKIVFLDAGHGGTDGGASYFGAYEKVINLEVTKKVKANLEALGYKVLMSRETDKTVGLLERSMAANISGADIFVSIHHNAMPGNSSVTGIETYYYEYDPDFPSKMNQQYHNDPKRILESSNLATEIHNTLIKNTGALNRGVRRNTFSVLRETALPAVLLELGYMSSPTELAKLKTSSYQNILAKAITNGIDAYFK